MDLAEVDKRVAALPEQRRRLLLQRAVSRRLPPLPPAAAALRSLSLPAACLHIDVAPYLPSCNQGVEPDAVDGHEAGSAAPSNGAAGWGFPTNLPPRQRLVEYLEQQQRAQQEAYAAAPQRRAMEDGQGTQQAQQRPLLLELLQQSRTFQSPDCAGGVSVQLCRLAPMQAAAMR